MKILEYLSEIKYFLTMLRRYGLPRIKNMEELWKIIRIINWAMHTDWHGYDYLFKNIKDELIAYMLKKYRDKIRVGYLVGATLTIELSEGPLVDDNGKLMSTSDYVKKKFGGRLISWWYPYYCEYSLDCFMVRYWSYDLYLQYYDAAKECDYEDLKFDYYGLIEISSKYGKIHGIVPRIMMWADYIGRFDYIMCRWRVYGWHSKEKCKEKTYSEKEIIEATYKASKVSETAKRLIHKLYIGKKIDDGD